MLPLIIDSVGLYSVRTRTDISFNGGLPLRVRGIVVGLDSTVTLNTSFRTMDGANTGQVFSTINDLEPNTTYFARLYAGNDDEIVFGEPVQFTTQAVQISLPSYIPAWGNKGYWPFNGNANDESGNQRHGTVYGTQLTSDRFGNPSSAYQFGSNNYITTSLTHLSTPTITIAAWAKTSSNQMEMTLASARGGSITGLYYNANQVVGTFGNSGGGFHNGDYYNSVCNDGDWHHVVMSYNDTAIRIYFDGNMVVDGSISFDLLFSGPFEFGRDNPYGRYFYGDLDDIGLWDRALSPQEIYQLYQAQCTLSVSLTNSTVAPYCQGDTISLHANSNSQSQYEWFLNQQPIITATDSIFLATQSGTYYLRTTSGVCVDNDSITITLNPLPSVSAGMDQNICIGSMVTLFGSGANTYSWNNGVQDGDSILAFTSTDYIVEGTDANGCLNRDTIVITVIPLPSVNAGADQAICEGDVITLFGNGATTYTWNNGIQNGVSFVVYSSSSYVLTGTDLNGCSNTDTVTLTIHPLPFIHAGADQAVCEGSYITLSGSGGLNFSWNNGIQDGVPFIPVNTSSYVISGVDSNGCVNHDTVNVNVNNLPYLNAGPNQYVCLGESITLYGNGANSLSWSNGIQDGVSFFPSGTESYILTSIDLNGCVGQDTVTVFVGNFSPPTVITTPSDLGICNGTGIVQTDPTGNFYSFWSNGFQGSTVNGLCSGYVSVTLIESTYGCSTQVYGFVEETGVVYPLSTQISLNDASVDSLCDGVASFFAFGGVSPYTYEIIDFNNNNVISSNSSISGLCSGLYLVNVTDAQGTIDSTIFYISDPSNVYSNNPYLDSMVIDTLYTDLIEDCSIDFGTVDSVWISEISYPNEDTVNVIWAIQDINGVDYISSQYLITNLFGTFSVELLLYCNQKSTGNPYFKIYTQIYIDSEELNVNSILGYNRQYNLFPNPTSDQIIVLSEEETQQEYFLMDSQGRIIIEGNLNGSKTFLSLSELAPGAYFLRIGTNKVLLKVVKQ
jgi:hypothetical protein